MKLFFEGFILAIGFFTRLPLPYIVKQIETEHYRFLAGSLPLVGGLLGVIMIGLYQGLHTLTSPLYVGVLVASIYLLMYGFLHLEALADIADAAYAKHSGKDAYEILKDPHIGAIGTISVMVFVVVKLFVLSLLLQEGAFGAVVLVLMLSRLMATGAICLLEMHPNSRFILQMKEALHRKDIVILFALLGMFSLIVQLWWLGLVAIMIAGLVARWLKAHIGFINGDGLGFMIEVVEVVLLNIVLLSY